MVYCGMVRSCFPAKQLTPWSRVFIENRLGVQRVRLSALYGTCYFITVIIRVHAFSTP